MQVWEKRLLLKDISMHNLKRIILVSNKKCGRKEGMGKRGEGRKRKEEPNVKV